jgi:hypothetical protein
MKKTLILLIFVFTYSFSLTPYSLENLKEVNIKVLNKKELISKELEEKIEEKIKKELKKLGIKTQSKKYSNFLVKIKVDKIKIEKQEINKQNYINFVRTAIILSEDVKLLRESNYQAVATTYVKEDSFESQTKELEDDIYESVIIYLLNSFIEQYKDEN